MNFKYFDKPFNYYELQSCLPEIYLKEVIQICNTLEPSNTLSGTRGDISNRFFINKKNNYDLGNFLNSHFKNLTKEIYTKENNKRISSIDFSESRFEIVHDGPGFWQIPHLDEMDKLITIIIYLGKTTNSQNNLGTDIFDDKKSFYKSIPYDENLGLAFIPSINSWHGFNKEKFTEGTRKLLIVNFVLNWKKKNELF